MNAIDQAPETRSPDEWVLAGFLARGVALAVDALVVALTVTALVMAVIALSGGQYRLDSALISTESCTQYPASAVESFSLPSDFRVDKVEVCTRSFFGIAFARKLEISQITRTGSHSDIKSYTAHLNSDLKVVDATTLDNVVDYGVLIGLFAWLLLFEWRSGATFGKRLVGSRVWSLDRSDMTLGQSAIRTLVRTAPFIACYVVAALMSHTGETDQPAAGSILLTIAVVWSPVIAYGLHVLIATRRGRSPVHDQLAGSILIRRTASSRSQADRKDDDDTAGTPVKVGQI